LCNCSKDGLTLPGDQYPYPQPGQGTLTAAAIERLRQRKNPKDTQYAVGFLHGQLFTAGTAMLESPRRDHHSINFCPFQTKCSQD
jgi:hypothetical protein